MKTIKITLLRRNIWYYLWRYSNGKIPFIKRRFVEIEINNLDKQFEARCNIKSGNYDLWMCDFEDYLQTWWTVEISDNYEGGMVVMDREEMIRQYNIMCKKQE